MNVRRRAGSPAAAAGSAGRSAGTPSSRRPCASPARPGSARRTCTYSSCGHLLPDGRRCGGRNRVTAEAEVSVRLRAVAARNRDVELRVAPHAVLVHVEALHLDGRLDADAPELVQDPEAAVRAPEHERADGDEPERLDAQLVEAAAVDEAL